MWSIDISWNIFRALCGCLLLKLDNFNVKCSLLLFCLVSSFYDWIIFMLRVDLSISIVKLIFILIIGNFMIFLLFMHVLIMLISIVFNIFLLFLVLFLSLLFCIFHLSFHIYLGNNVIYHNVLTFSCIYNHKNQSKNSRNNIHKKCY